MKRLLWALSGIIATILLVFNSGSSASAIIGTVLNNDKVYGTYSTWGFDGSSVGGIYTVGRTAGYMDIEIYGSNGFVSIYDPYLLTGGSEHESDFDPTWRNQYMSFSYTVSSDSYFSTVSSMPNMALCPTSSSHLTVISCDVSVSSYNAGQSGQQDGRNSLYYISLVAFINPQATKLQFGGVLYLNTYQSGVVAPLIRSTWAFSVITIYNHGYNPLGGSDTTTAIKDAANQAHSDAEAQLQEQQKQTEAIEQTKDFVTDTSTPEAGDIANSDSLPSVGLLPAGPLDSILLLPVNILNSIIQSFGGNCSPVVAPLPFVGENLTFPCFSDTFYTGSMAPLATLLGGVASAFILYKYFKHLYKKVDRAVSLETTDEDEWGIL